MRASEKMKALMDLVKLQEKLIRAARGNPPNDRVPYSFEQRILARLKAEPAVELAALWARAMGRAAALCLCIMLLLLGAWLRFGPTHTAAPGDLSQEFENTLLAASDLDQPADSAW